MSNPLAVYRRDPDRFDIRNHPCGCKTYWSIGRDKSVATFRCPDHAPHDPDYRAALKDAS